MSLLQNVVTWFSGLTEPVKQFLVIASLLLTALGLLLPFFIALQAAALAMGASIVGMITAAAPIAGIVLGIIAAFALLVVGIQQLWQHNESFRNVVIEVWNAISSFLSSIIESISSFIMSIWGTLSTWWTENQQLILTAVRTVWNLISTIISNVLTVISPIIQGCWENIKTITTGAWESIKVLVETAINLVLGIIKSIMQLITGDWNGAWETIKQVLSTVWEGIKSIISIVLNTISQMISHSWNGISNTISSVMTVISSFISTIWSTIQSIISSVLSHISSTVSTIWNGIQSTVSNVLNAISSTVSSVWNGIKNTISSAINTARDVVSSAINAIKNLFHFQIRWPHIPLPHFKVSGSANPLDWLKGGLPSIGIDWYAKGGILTKPTVFGMTGNRLMVGGESGHEAILPLNGQTLGAIGESIAKTMTNQLPPIQITITGNIVREEVDLERIANLVSETLFYEIKRQQGLKGIRL